MYFPKLNTPGQTRVTVNRFLGLDRRCGAAKGSFVHMENLWGEDYPALSVRQGRQQIEHLTNPNGLCAKETLIWADGTTIYLNNQAAGLSLSNGPKQLISMGAYLVIWPDKKYINTADPTEYGSLEQTMTTSGQVRFTLCDGEGAELENYLCGDSAPENPTGGALWLDTSGDEDVLRRYGESGWSEVSDTCVRITASGIGAGFAVGDGVSVSGASPVQLNGAAVLKEVGGDSIVIPGLLRAAVSQTAAVTVRRSVPDMDFVTECGNRLWGCKYGIVDGRSVNEIYGCKLGDFKNWNCFQGLSTDSYAASRGSDGPFTAAVTYLGSVLFFKENCIERLYVSQSGAHQIATTQCPGIKRGSHRSAVEVDGTLYYHAQGGIYAYQGSLPAPVSGGWGDLMGRDAVSGGWAGQYFVSLTDADNHQHLLVYDTARGLWYRQDALKVQYFAGYGGELYALTGSGDILKMRGGTEQVSWLAESSDWGLDSPENKYLERLVLRMELPRGSRVESAVSYDGGFHWEKQRSAVGNGLESVVLHIRPRRCRQLRLRLSGTGRCRLHAISAVYEKGSDEG